MNKIINAEQMREKVISLLTPALQVHVAEFLGIDESTMSLIVSGKRTVPPGAAKKLGYTKKIKWTRVITYERDEE